ncbi:UBX domain-containing protein 2 [Elsinoe australis]|uniref:UBX domain-containing protein 2 n=1 Tax=Elsinoe australis TaxID=40998 RepID=A0A4U7B3Y3_9PEZI|nr:UBX domain-containing protein 2 [Elsinoe australis]
MTDPSIDLSSLNQEQQLALQQFTSVTDQDVGAAVALLQRCQWNAQIAITRFFDGDTETVDVAAEAQRQAPPPIERRHENLQDSLDAGAFRRPTRQFDPAPRVVPTPESQMTQRVPFIISLVFLPFNITYNIFARIFGTIGWAFPILPRLLSRLWPAQSARSARYANRKPLNPRDTAARFVREFEEEHGSEPGTLPFQESGYAQAFDTAKKDLKYLLVVLLSPEHDDTAPFARDTLLSPDFVSWVKERQSELLLWAGNVRDSEAYQVANALNVTKFPFVGLIVHTPSVSSTAMSVVARNAGPIPASELIDKLQKAITTRNEELSSARRQRQEQQATRNIREEQNSAYERSLAQDRERARQRREAEAARERAEREERERVEAKEQRARNILQWRKWRAQSLPAEPGQDATDIVRISIRMPSGDRVIRKFEGDADLEELYAFVECYDVLQEGLDEKETQEPAGFEHEYGFQLVSPMPREVYDLEKGGSIKRRVGTSGNLIVEKTIMDDDDDEEDDEVTA